jgi:hypothetical protein
LLFEYDIRIICGSGILPRYSSILDWTDEHLNIQTNRCEIPLLLTRQRSYRAKDGRLKPVLDGANIEGLAPGLNQFFGPVAKPLGNNVT